MASNFWEILGGLKMTVNELLMYRAELVYSIQSFKGKSLLDWAVLWFETSNNATQKYGYAGSLI